MYKINIIKINHISVKDNSKQVLALQVKSLSQDFVVVFLLSESQLALLDLLEGEKVVSERNQDVESL